MHEEPTIIPSPSMGEGQGGGDDGAATLDLRVSSPSGRGLG